MNSNNDSTTIFIYVLTLISTKSLRGETMNNILAKDVMITNIYTITPKKRIALARLRMLRHSVGALPVVDDENNLLGIITLRDIDLAGETTSELLVEDLMSIDLKTGNENTKISEIAGIMLQTGIQRVPIIDKNNKLIGLITQTVVIKAAMDLFD